VSWCASRVSMRAVPAPPCVFFPVALAISFYIRVRYSTATSLLVHCSLFTSQPHLDPTVTPHASSQCGAG
jgi:hypothetical protein